MTTFDQTHKQEQSPTGTIWKRHSNPISAWSRILTFPLLFAPFWFESGILAIIAAVWFALNPIIFPAPKNNKAWSTRGVLGERIWSQNIKMNADTLILALSLISTVIGIVFALQQDFWPMFAFGAIGVLAQLWYFDRMHFLYDRHQRKERT